MIQYNLENAPKHAAKTTVEKSMMMKNKALRAPDQRLDMHFEKDDLTVAVTDESIIK